MKLSTDFYEFRRIFGEKEGFKVIKNAGFDAIDFSYYWLDDKEKNEILGENYKEYAEKIKIMLAECGLVCNQAHAPFEFSAENDSMDISNKHFSEVAHAIESAAIMGAEHIVIHSLRVPEGMDFTETNLTYYKSLEPYCKESGIKIAVENLFGQPYDNEKKVYLGRRFATPEEMNEFISLLDSPYFVCCTDVGHCTITGIMPEDYIAGMSGRVLRCLHIQDNDFEDDIHTLPYLGKIHWEKVMKSLKKIGYEGDLTMEIFGFWHRFDKKLLPKASELAASVGKRLIGIFESE